MLVAIAALLCLAALAPAVAAAAPTGAIEGTVTGSDTNEGVEGVEVCATRDESPFIESCALTGLDGTYAIEALPAGDYEVWFYGRLAGYHTRSYSGLVAVGTEPVTGIDAQLDPMSSISGVVVRSSDGEPVSDVEVCAFGIFSEEFGGCTYTESDGSYEIEEVEPGEYGVEFWPYESGQNLVVQYYNHRARWSEADPVRVEEGESVEGIDAELDPGATISGHVSSALTGASLEEIPVCAIDATSDELWICNWTEPDGSYELPLLSAGPYKVIFSVDFAEWYGEEFGEEENDGLATQFWNNQTTLAAANVLALTTGQAVSGVDARLGSLPPVLQPPAVVTPQAAPPPPKRIRKHCRKGHRLKKVKGKYRCVKRKKHRRHHHHAAGRPQFRIVR